MLIIRHADSTPESCWEDAGIDLRCGRATAEELYALGTELMAEAVTLADEKWEEKLDEMEGERDEAMDQSDQLREEVSHLEERVAALEALLRARDIEVPAAPPRPRTRTARRRPPRRNRRRS